MSIVDYCWFLHSTHNILYIDVPFTPLLLLLLMFAFFFSVPSIFAVQSGSLKNATNVRTCAVSLFTLTFGFENDLNSMARKNRCLFDETQFQNMKVYRSCQWQPKRTMFRLRSVIARIAQCYLFFLVFQILLRNLECSVGLVAPNAQQKIDLFRSNF